MPAQSHLLKRAILLSQSGDQKTARQILKGILMQDETNQAAWIHYAKTFSSPRDQQAALRKALERHPDMAEVQKAFHQLVGRVRTFQTDAPAVMGSQVLVSGQAARGRRAAAARPEAQHSGGSILSLLLTVFAVLAMIGSAVYNNNLLAERDGEIQQVRQENNGLKAYKLKMGEAMQNVTADLQAEKDRNIELNKTVAGAREQYLGLEQKHQELNQSYQAQQKAFQTLSSEHRSLQEQHQALSDDYTVLIQEKQDLEGRYGSLAGQYDTLSGEYSTLLDSYNNIKDKAVLPPYIAVWNRQVTVSFYNSKGSVVYWTVPFDMLEKQIQSGIDSRNWLFLGGKNIKLPAGDYVKYTAIDYRSFVDPAPFNQLIPELYRQSSSEEEFLHEVWYMVSQLANYTSDNNSETPRYPLETLLAGGGDCEDTSILFASMVKAAPAPWKVSLGYINTHNMNELTAPNHLIVAVETGTKVYFIETTGGDSMTPYAGQPAGWYLEIP
jgi:hypothetical protein